MEHIDSMINFHDEQVDIYADLDSAQYIEDCNACIRDEQGTIIRTGTYQAVIDWAYRKGFRF